MSSTFAFVARVMTRSKRSTVKMMREGEKVISYAMPACVTAIHRAAVPPVDKALLTRPEGEAPAHFGRSGKDALKQHVRGEVRMLTPVEVPRRPAGQA